MSEELRFQGLPNAPIDQAQIILLPIGFEKTVCGKGGTAMAPKAILKASEQLEYYEEDLEWSPLRHMQIHVQPLVESSQDETNQQFHQRLTELSAKLFTQQDKKLHIALGGEHSITPSLTKGGMPETGTIVFLDAHADLRTSYQGTRYSHACPATRLREQGHKVLLIGTRSFYEDEMARIKDDTDIQVFKAKDLRHSREFNHLLAQLESLEGPIWLSIDMDVFDPSVMPGVGTPQPGGLGWYDVIDIVNAVVMKSNSHLCGVDIVELIPEPSEVSQVTAAKLIQKIISFWGKANQYDRANLTGSQQFVDNQE